MFIDAHCHCHEFPESEIERILNSLNIALVIVSENVETSKKTFELSKRLDKVTPCIGIHPWEVKGEKSLEQASYIIEKIGETKCFGEVGLDKRFNKENYIYQRNVFEKFVEVAAKQKKVLNIHALDAWDEAIELVHEAGVKKAIFHWYSGPISLLEKIFDYGYFITINPSVKFQKKHGAVLKNAPLEIILTESDGPYNYRGKVLHPEMVPDLIKYISQIKNVSEEEIKEKIVKNFKFLFP